MTFLCTKLTVNSFRNAIQFHILYSKSNLLLYLSKTKPLLVENIWICLDTPSFIITHQNLFTISLHQVSGVTVLTVIKVHCGEKWIFISLSFLLWC